MTPLAVSLFTVLVGGLGLGALRLVDPRAWPERLALALPVGLGAWPFAVLALRLLHLPLDWRVAGLVGLAGIGLSLADRRRAPALAEPRAAGLVVAAALAAALAAVMYAGATRYPYLEDDDSWQHAVAARWVALQGTTVQPEPPVTLFLEPYPPHYAALMGVLHQVNPDLKDVLKFFNALIAGLSVLGAFLAFEALSGSAGKALAAAALLAVSPSYMSHFIWAQTLAIPVFFAALWALARLPAGARWWTGGPSWLAFLLAWSATIIQPSTAAVSGLLLAVGAAVRAAAGRVSGEGVPRAEMTAVAAAGAASLATWLTLMPRQLAHYASQPGTFTGGASADTSGNLVYGLRDILLDHGVKIDQGTGLGWATAALGIIGLATAIARWRHDPRAARLVMVAWLAIGLVGIEGNALPWKLFPHRFWVFLAIPVASLAAEGAAALASLASAGWARAGTFLVAAGVAFGTNLGPRLTHELSMWRPGLGWPSEDQLGAWLQTADHLGRWAHVLAPCFRDDYLIGLNLHAEPWAPAVRDLRRRLSSASGLELAEIMEARRFEYLALDGSCLQRIGTDDTRRLAREVAATGRFRIDATAPDFVVFQLLTR